MTPVEVVFEHGGMLDKYIGDEFVAVFGVPVSTDRDAERAVLCALKMREALAALNGERELAGKERIRIRVGVDTGLVLAGNIGSELRSDFTLIGTTVQRAKKIEQLNKQFATDILISHAAYQHVGGKVTGRAQPEVALPDLEDTIKTYHVLEVTAA